MIYVHLDSPTNSTIFTNCCNVAINDHQDTCPGCRAEVYPGKNATDHQRGMNRWNWAYGRQLRGVREGGK
jgi:hypothetical protein